MIVSTHGSIVSSKVSKSIGCTELVHSNLTIATWRSELVVYHDVEFVNGFNSDFIWVILNQKLRITK